MATVAVPEVGEDWLTTLNEHRSSDVRVETIGMGVRYDLRFKHERSLGQALRELLQRPPADHFWALRNINLTVAAGECLAIVGRNGAGKSTLLQVVAGLLPPDEGSVRIDGPVSALLNLGVGFDQLLTGRENIQLLGSLMGLRPAEVRAKQAEVIEFTGLGRFIDAPLRTYSSGMRARLGFAASTMIEPNVLVLDEVIGTGDAAFRDLSRNRLQDMVSHAHAVIASTHDMGWVAENATYALLLDGGRVLAEGSPTAIAALHRSRSFKPPREYDCSGCGGQPLGGHCQRCGLLRHVLADAGDERS